MLEGRFLISDARSGEGGRRLRTLNFLIGVKY